MQRLHATTSFTCTYPHLMLQTSNLFSCCIPPHLNSPQLHHVFAPALHAVSLQVPFNHLALYSSRLGTLQVCSWNAVNLAVLAAPASATLQCLELQCQLLLSLTPSCPGSSSICKHCSSGAALAASEGLDSAGTAGSLMLQSVRSTLPAPAPRRTGPRMQISHLPCLFY